VPSGTVDLLEDDCRLGDAQPQSPVLGGDERRQIAGLGERVDELFGILAVAVALLPVLLAELFAQCAHRTTQCGVSGRVGCVGEIDGHALLPSW
jgi:hypothetical protein